MSNLSKIRTLNTRKILCTQAIHFKQFFFSLLSIFVDIYSHSERTSHNLQCSSCQGEGKGLFFLSLQHKSNSRWSHCASGQCCPFCFHIANTNCSRRFFLFRKHAPAEPLFYYGTMVKICFCTANIQREGVLKGVANHTLVFAHWWQATNPQQSHSCTMGGPGHATFTH